jgi:hypothetical protein
VVAPREPPKAIMKTAHTIDVASSNRRERHAGATAR